MGVSGRDPMTKIVVCLLFSMIYRRFSLADGVPSCSFVIGNLFVAGLVATERDEAREQKCADGGGIAQEQGKQDEKNVRLVQSRS